ncbi:protein of unknown function [Petrocella atlantisensis]|uniref:Integrase catalytic domain-containing protein n=1 Tax=Petrocella atlantisensis TaxID=2173034 RepID=A0A3P7PIA4_9FIRM|nr:protein of unknown function [Petrocella atlantisensis]
MGTTILNVSRDGLRSKTITREYIQHYNYDRGHQSYKYKTPAEIYYATAEKAA